MSKSSYYMTQLVLLLVNNTCLFFFITQQILLRLHTMQSISQICGFPLWMLSLFPPCWINVNVLWCVCLKLTCRSRFHAFCITSHQFIQSVRGNDWYTADATDGVFTSWGSIWLIHLVIKWSKLDRVIPSCIFLNVQHAWPRVDCQMKQISHSVSGGLWCWISGQTAHGDTFLLPACTVFIVHQSSASQLQADSPQ